MSPVDWGQIGGIAAAVLIGASAYYKAHRNENAAQQLAAKNTLIEEIKAAVLPLVQPPK
jgi:hypothetical protein